jgi:hypothetical protein
MFGLKLEVGAIETMLVVSAASSVVELGVLGWVVSMDSLVVLDDSIVLLVLVLVRVWVCLLANKSLDEVNVVVGSEPSTVTVIVSVT